MKKLQHLKGKELSKEQMKSISGGKCKFTLNLFIVSFDIGPRGCAEGDAVHWAWE